MSSFSSRQTSTIDFAVGQCQFGTVLVAQDQKGICALFLGDGPEPLIQQLRDEFPQAQLSQTQQALEPLVNKAVSVIQEPQLGVELPLHIQGSDFQKKVWKALLRIPVGQTVSYSELAESIGSPKASRAVASACAANRLAVVIPCHRVRRRSGELSGYRWGVERKRELLDLEAATHTM